MLCNFMQCKILLQTWYIHNSVDHIFRKVLEYSLFTITVVRDCMLSKRVLLSVIIMLNRGLQ